MPILGFLLFGFIILYAMLGQFIHLSGVVGIIGIIAGIVVGTCVILRVLVAILKSML